VVLSSQGGEADPSDVSEAAQAAKGALSEVAGTQVWLSGTNVVVIRTPKLNLVTMRTAGIAMDDIGRGGDPAISASESTAETYTEVSFTFPRRLSAQDGADFFVSDPKSTPQKELTTFARSLATGLSDPAPAKVTVRFLGNGPPRASLEVVAFPPVGAAATAAWVAYISAAMKALAHPPAADVDPVSITNTAPAS
jgi:hypothetical protein